LNHKYSFLAHRYSPFSKSNISKVCKEYGFETPESVESHLWVYELYYQIQKRAGSSCVLKGGACAQLYLSLETQRCTLDLDLATTLNPKQLFQLLSSIVDEFNSYDLFSDFREYIPRQPISDNKLIPMKTYLFSLPFIYKGRAEKGFPDIKIDFVFLPTDVLPTSYINNSRTVGLKLNYSPFSLSKHSIISNKLLTFAVNSIGLEKHKIESFYKNVYDLFYLIKEYNNLSLFKSVSDIIYDNICLEFSLKNLEPINTLIMLDDILITLYDLFTFDLLFLEPRLSKRVSDFELRCLQSSARSDLNLDTWSIMIMYIYIWVITLKEYVISGNTSSIKMISEIMDYYEYYLSLDKKERRIMMKEYRKVIFSKDTRLMLTRSIHPLRVIYLYFICDRFL
jgi:hypothetical protein